MILNLLLNYLILIIIVLVSISFFTLFERKLLSYIQLRKGPNKVGIIGILQAFSDGIKLFLKEFIFLIKVNWIYYLSPFLMFMISFFIWILFPFYYYLLNLNNYMLVLFCILSLNIYPLMFSGIFSNSMYSMLGGLRSIAQTISYEVSFILLIFSFMLLIESFNLNFFFLKMNLIILMFPLSLILYISILAELNRTPFDFSEGESELISGYNIEYMSSGFILIFLSEYGNIMFLMLIFIYINFFIINLFLIYLLWMLMMFLVILIRGLLPRLRYDKLMLIVWLNYLPISLNYLIFISMMKFIIY